MQYISPRSIQSSHIMFIDYIVCMKTLFYCMLFYDTMYVGDEIYLDSMVLWKSLDVMDGCVSIDMKDGANDWSLWLNLCIGD